MRRMPEREKLLREIEAFLAKYGMAPTRFGRDAMRGDANFVLRLRADKTRDVKSSTIDELRKWMREYAARPRPTGSAARAKSKAA